MMADSASEVDLESDASSVDGSLSLRESSAKNEQLQRRVDSLTQENRVLKKELETMKLKLKNLQEVNQQLRRDSVSIQAKAEQEEEFISNTLLKKITELKKEKESLALNYEQEEECLTNELSRKFTQLRQEKVALEKTLAREQENQVNKLKRRIEKLEGDMNNKQDCLERLRWEKIELENALEQEQEALVNRLWKKMEKLETEKRMLQEKLESASAPLSGSSSALNLSNVSHQDAPTQASCIVSSQFSRAAPSGSISGGDHPVYISLTSGQASPTSPGTSCQNSVSNTTPVRPTSSGPGSQGGSLRRHHHSHGQQQFPQQSQSGTVSSNRLSLLINPVSTSDGSGYSVAIPSGPVSALSNVTTSRSMTHSSIPLDAGGPNAEVAETMSLRSASCKIGAISAPPQSPMELDTADTGLCGSSHTGINSQYSNISLIPPSSICQPMSSSSTPHGFCHSNAIIQPHHSSHTEASVSFSSGNKHLSANPVGPAPIQPSSSASTTFSHQPANLSNMDSNQVSEYVAQLRNEVFRLRKIVDRHQEERATKLASLDREERSAVEENRRLRKALQSEIQRREALSRQLSESESSLEMEDERQVQFNEASRHSFSGSTRVRTTSDSSSSFNLPFHPQPYPPGFFNPIGMCGPGTGCTQQTSLNPAFYGPGHAYAAAVAAAAAARSAACTGSSVPLSNEPSSSASRVCRECGQLVCLPVTSVVPIGGTSLTPNCSSGCTSTNLPIIPSSSGGISPSHPQSNVSLSSGYAAPFGHINQPQRPIASASHSPSPSPSPMSPNSTPGVCGSAFTSGCQHGSSFTSTNLAGPSSCSYSMTRHIGYPALSNYAISAGTAGAGRFVKPSPRGPPTSVIPGVQQTNTSTSLMLMMTGGNLLGTTSSSTSSSPGDSGLGSGVSHSVGTCPRPECPPNLQSGSLLCSSSSSSSSPSSVSSSSSTTSSISVKSMDVKAVLQDTHASLETRESAPTLASGASGDDRRRRHRRRARDSTKERRSGHSTENLSRLVAQPCETELTCDSLRVGPNSVWRSTGASRGLVCVLSSGEEEERERAASAHSSLFRPDFVQHQQHHYHQPPSHHHSRAVPGEPIGSGYRRLGSDRDNLYSDDLVRDLRPGLFIRSVDEDDGASAPNAGKSFVDDEVTGDGDEDEDEERCATPPICHINSSGILQKRHSALRVPTDK